MPIIVNCVAGDRNRELANEQERQTEKMKRGNEYAPLLIPGSAPPPEPEPEAEASLELEPFLGRRPAGSSTASLSSRVPSTTIGEGDRVRARVFYPRNGKTETAEEY